MVVITTALATTVLQIPDFTFIIHSEYKVE